MPRLSALPTSIRLAAGCFAALILGFALLAQVNLWFQVAGGRQPEPDEVLTRYHGDPNRSRLDDVLDGARDTEDPHNMWMYLVADGRWEDEAVQTARTTILDWVRAGAPEEGESGWDSVKPIFTGMGRCGDCHVEGGVKDDMPFTTYEQVLPLTRPGGKYPLAKLLISAHNHLFSFAVLALLTSLGVCLTRVRGRLRNFLIVGASAGAALDIAGWFLTRTWGSPFHIMIMGGGALFGLCTTVMALAILFEAAFGRPPKTDAST